MARKTRQKRNTHRVEGTYLYSWEHDEMEKYKLISSLCSRPGDDEKRELEVKTARAEVLEKYRGRLEKKREKQERENAKRKRKKPVIDVDKEVKRAEELLEKLEINVIKESVTVVETIHGREVPRLDYRFKVRVSPRGYTKILGIDPRKMAHAFTRITDRLRMHVRRTDRSIGHMMDIFGEEYDEAISDMI